VIVVDASAVVELLVNAPAADAIGSRIRRARRLAAPHLLDAEVGQVLRRFVRGGQLSVLDAQAALLDLAALPITRYPNGPLLARAFELRDNATVYDALYLVLAEAMRVPLITRDAALARVPGHHARVDVV
jgi:predicted nucleic acid-binding protein